MGGGALLRRFPFDRGVPQWENFFRHKGLPPREIVKVDLHPRKDHFESDDRFDYRFPDWDTRYFFADMAAD
jgi:hypothetical protein